MRASGIAILLDYLLAPQKAEFEIRKSNFLKSNLVPNTNSQKVIHWISFQQIAKSGSD